MIWRWPRLQKPRNRALGTGWSPRGRRRSGKCGQAREPARLVQRITLCASAYLQQASSLQHCLAGAHCTTALRLALPYIASRRFGSHVSWYFSHVAGLTPTLPGWQRVRVRPHVSDQSDGISSVSIAHDTAFGEFHVSWRRGPPVEALTCATPTEEGWNLTFACADAAIESILFASYGVITGQCGDYDDSFCHANNSHAVATVEALCVGRRTCRVPVSSAVFGDACPAFTKLLSVQFRCEKPAPSPLFELAVTLVGSSGGQVDVPLPSGSSFDEVTIIEGGAAVWKGGAFVGGTDGVRTGSRLNLLASRGLGPSEKGPGRYVSFDVLRGRYRFVLFA